MRPCRLTWPICAYMHRLALIGAALNHMGDIGVDMFFVLSGFLISWMLLREYDKYGEIDFINFVNLGFNLPEAKTKTPIRITTSDIGFP